MPGIPVAVQGCLNTHMQAGQKNQTLNKITLLFTENSIKGERNESAWHCVVEYAIDGGNNLMLILCYWPWEQKLPRTKKVSFFKEVQSLPPDLVICGGQNSCVKLKSKRI